MPCSKRISTLFHFDCWIIYARAFAYVVLAYAVLMLLDGGFAVRAAILRYTGSDLLRLLLALGLQGFEDFLRRCRRGHDAHSYSVVNRIRDRCCRRNQRRLAHA